ncbi:MAG: (2Fe-2S)-binding protein [Collimonas sp.]|uniref:(2Fe-2S)-binding protein n=1 Tax=Collimonas sp. TaxID=1963772 RepID=UPI0032651E99
MTLFLRIAETQRATVSFVLDGRKVSALEGDTVLTAVLTQADSLRVSEFSGRPRAGFCLIGACQDCWIRSEDGQPLRACSTTIQAGMRLRTSVAGQLPESSK